MTVVITRDAFAWIAHLDTCMGCMETMVSRGLAVRSPAPEGRSYACTPEGERAFPGLAIVDSCPMDGVPIYQRWLDRGIATKDACPFCTGNEDVMHEEHSDERATRPR